jgi:hypothetical protein
MNPDHYDYAPDHYEYRRGGHRYPMHSRRQYEYRSNSFDEETKVELEPPAPPPMMSRPHSALDDCMTVRDRRCASRDSLRKPPDRFYDSAYDDVIRRKEAEYARDTPRPRTGIEVASQHSRTSSSSRREGPMVELGPGLYARLRGASETWACVENDFHVPACCISCALDLCCIQDADYVLCPRCRVVSPLDDAHQHHGGENGGVGLGFTYDELFTWQTEIMRRRTEGNKLKNDDFY